MGSKGESLPQVRADGSTLSPTEEQTCLLPSSYRLLRCGREKNASDLPRLWMKPKQESWQGKGRFITPSTVLQSAQFKDSRVFTKLPCPLCSAVIPTQIPVYIPELLPRAWCPCTPSAHTFPSMTALFKSSPWAFCAEQACQGHPHCQDVLAMPRFERLRWNRTEVLWGHWLMGQGRRAGADCQRLLQVRWVPEQCSEWPWRGWAPAGGREASWRGRSREVCKRLCLLRCAEANPSLGGCWKSPQAAKQKHFLPCSPSSTFFL